MLAISPVEMNAPNGIVESLTDLIARRERRAPAPVRPEPTLADWTDLRRALRRAA